jgi:hypothetical protein
MEQQHDADRRLSAPEQPKPSRRRGEPQPKLTPRWFLVLVFSNGTTHELPCDSQADAERLGNEFRHARWRVEKEMVGPRVIVGPVRQNRIVVENVADTDPGANGQHAR